MRDFFTEGAVRGELISYPRGVHLKMTGLFSTRARFKNCSVKQ